MSDDDFFPIEEASPDGADEEELAEVEEKKLEEKRKKNKERMYG